MVFRCRSTPCRYAHSLVRIAEPLPLSLLLRCRGRWRLKMPPIRLSSSLPSRLSAILRMRPTPEHSPCEVWPGLRAWSEKENLAHIGVYRFPGMQMHIPDKPLLGPRTHACRRTLPKPDPATSFIFCLPPQEPTILNLQTQVETEADETKPAPNFRIRAIDIDIASETNTTP